jgi:hypothetical protein
MMRRCIGRVSSLLSWSRPYTLSCSDSREPVVPARAAKMQQAEAAATALKAAAATRAEKVKELDANVKELDAYVKALGAAVRGGGDGGRGFDVPPFLAEKMADIAMLHANIKILRERVGRLSKTDERLQKDDEARLAVAKADLKDEEARLKDATADVKDAEEHLELLLRHRPWWQFDVSDPDNPSGCCAPRPGQPSGHEWKFNPDTEDVNHWFPFIERYGVVARTSLKTDLLRLVLDRLMLLVVSSMKGMDTACVTGERGGGKTHTLRLLTRAIADEFPDKVLPVYIDYSKYTTMADPVPLPSTLIEVALAQRGYRTEEPMGMMVALDIISKLDLRLVLFVDEFETLFQHHKDVTPSALRIASFNAVESELNAIGNEQTGRCVAYLCGSSGSLPELISCRRNNAQLVTLYPMLQYAIDLNGSKTPRSTSAGRGTATSSNSSAWCRH